VALKLAELSEQARAEKRFADRQWAASTVQWDKPADLYPDYADQWSAIDRTRPEPPPWRTPVSAAEAQDRLRRIAYPPAGSFPERYAAVMWQVSAATGTSSRWERPATWPRHAIEAPAAETELAA